MITAFMFLFSLQQQNQLMSGVKIPMDWAEYDLVRGFFTEKGVPYVGLQSMATVIVMKGDLAEVDQAIIELDRETGIRITRKNDSGTVTTTWPTFSHESDHGVSAVAFLSKYDPKSSVARAFESQVRPMLRKEDQILGIHYTLHPIFARYGQMSEAIDGAVSILRKSRSKIEIPILWYAGIASK